MPARNRAQLRQALEAVAASRLMAGWNSARVGAEDAVGRLVRDRAWGQAAIPVSEVRGTAMDLGKLSYASVILEEQGTACEFALD